MNCHGDEEHLSLCEHPAWGHVNCAEDNCVRVFCLGGGPSPLSKLVHNERTGILSVFYNSETRAVCVF